MTNYAELINSYLAGPALLRQAVAGISREQLLARPVAGKWSTMEVVCHLVDFEPVYAHRMKRTIAEDNPQLLSADEKRFAAALRYHDRDLAEELALLEHTRSQMGRILRTLPPVAFHRVGIHNERGPLTLEQLLTTITNHVPHHLKFVAEKRKALGLSA
jgi:uncharacterized damage-inducible protein DinB